MKTTIDGQVTKWSDDILQEWEERAMPRFSAEEHCSHANYFAPRPYVDEYNTGSRYAGFIYTVQPANRVCQIRWIPLRSER